MLLIKELVIIDEIHLSAKGEDLLAKDLSIKILDFYGFISSNNSQLSLKNESRITNSNIKNLRKRVGKNSTMLGIWIRKYIYRKKDFTSNNKNIVIPTDIYTTS